MSSRGNLQKSTRKSTAGETEKSETRDRPVVQLLRSRERGQLDTHALAAAPGQAAASAGHTEERRTGAAPWAGDRVAKRDRVKKPNVDGPVVSTEPVRDR